MKHIFLLHKNPTQDELEEHFFDIQQVLKNEKHTPKEILYSFNINTAKASYKLRYLEEDGDLSSTEHGYQIYMKHDGLYTIEYFARARILSMIVDYERFSLEIKNPVSSILLRHAKNSLKKKIEDL